MTKIKKRITITLTEEEYNLIKEDAERNYRSFNDELRYKLKLIKADTEQTPVIQHHLSYPPGVRSPENPEGRPTLTNDYNSYYKTTPQKRGSVIG